MSATATEVTEPTTLEAALEALDQAKVRYEKLRLACQTAKAACRRALVKPDLALADPLHASHRVADILGLLDQVPDVSGVNNS